MIEPYDLRALQRGELTRPYAVLGPHRVDGAWQVRAWHPDAQSVEVLQEGCAPVAGDSIAPGLFMCRLAAEPGAYRLRFTFADGETWETPDPYRQRVAVRTKDRAALSAGTHRRLWHMLGAHETTVGGVPGVRFVVWAPHARAARLVTQSNGWDGRLWPMASLDDGLFGLFVPGAAAGLAYRFELVTPEGLPRPKSDPLGRRMDPPPGAASRVARSEHRWGDAAWMRRRARTDPRARPLSIYEVHLGSWRRDGDRMLSYREVAPLLVAHVQRLGFTHIELLPVAEHAYYPSWGYQVTGFYAPTARYGDPDDLRSLIDHCHQHGIGVLLDWVPAHFPKDEHALREFDGRRLYEREGEHPDWGTLRFDVARPEVRAFLLSNALYWLREFHADGLRVDAVSWLVYRDYLEKEPPWTVDEAGIGFLRELNQAVAEEASGAITVAEESTDFAGVTASLEDGGLGFTFKWDMGWMHDTLRYVSLPFAERPAHHEWLTFPFSYQPDEHFIDPLSHDEVVHLKRSLLGRLPGTDAERFAQLRLLLAHQLLRPGKALVFMGTELAPAGEWNHDVALDWDSGQHGPRKQLAAFVQALLTFYRDSSPLWRGDAEGGGFAWIAGTDAEHGVLVFARRDGRRHLVVVLHHGASALPAYRVGVPGRGRYRVVLTSDARRFGGSGKLDRARPRTEDVDVLGWKRSVTLDLPPLCAVVLRPERVADVQEPPAGAVPRQDSK